MQESKYRCINVYAPNNEYERVKFISALPSIINDSDEEDTYIETILGGDFIVSWTMRWIVRIVIVIKMLVR